MKDKKGRTEDEVPEDTEKPKKTDMIDDLLGGLSSDMEKMGVNTVAKGHCAACSKCIAGKVKTVTGISRLMYR